ncbi:MAG: RagB/SusD family nutrient uptake outer membrane protein [Dysgonamonadaceae bacterium]|jgi:hypothetical protein|nr:RagB/SusD family nutrient uptake outer membrane protein [Dysgonamonadaceae bacterium]
MKKYKILVIIGTLLTAMACTDLEVVPYSEISPDNYYKDKVQIIAGVNRIYTHSWNSVGMGGYNRISETSADQLAWTNKGRHGYDGGVHGRQHYHSWTVDDNDACWDPWRTLFTGVGYANSIMDDFENVIDFAAAGISDTERQELESEIRGIRALFYMKLMDLYGNIPVVTTVGSPVNPPTVSRADVFKFVETELLEAAKTAAPLSKEKNGRFTLAAIYASLVELYLNAEVWSGTARWDDCITYCNKLINGEGGAINGVMELDDDVETTFSNANQSRSKEIIWSNASNKSKGRWVNPVNIAHFRERDILNTDYGANNGLIVTANAIESYSDRDLRKTSWFLYGIGKHPNQGPYLNIATADEDDYVVGTEEFAGLPLIFCNKPIKAVIDLDISGDDVTIVIKEWYSPEFPGEEAKLLIQNAFNGKGIKDILIENFTQDNNEVYLSGGYNLTDPRQYSWSQWNDYRYVWYDCKENSGARIYKYHPGQYTDADYGNADLVFYRLTDVYFAKAEALMRKSGVSQEVVSLINDVKRRAFEADYWNSDEAIANKDRYTTATLTMDELLAERGREFILEAKRRTDLIRFDKFEFAIPWWDANAGYGDGSGGSIVKDKTRRLLAIPRNALNVNPNLKQNDGYED